tara:strand:+ start:30031 stop:31062 length:1032 start_codon:yes stop_codon:yes gene_type:complete
MGVVDTIVGLQWGSEGKGKISAYLSPRYQVMVRSGGPQAGHTFYQDGVKYVNRQIPCGVFSDCFMYIAPAGMVNLKVLEDEIKRYGLTPERLMIDKNAMVVTQEHIETEQKSSLKMRLASTCEGVGAAQVDKFWRKGVLFGNFVKGSWLEKYCGDVVGAIHSHIDSGGTVLIEGTQGFGLCLNHGEYPFVTSRDVTSSALLNDAGVSPRDHRKTIGVLRTYPIRVGGNSGPTYSSEISWEKIEKSSGSTKVIREYTTVTGRLRRVFEQDYETLERAIIVNNPDELALMFLDYINAEDFGKEVFEDLSNKSQDYVFELEERLKVPIRLIGTGPEERHIIDRCAT